jgi:hypothetical protein
MLNARCGTGAAANWEDWGGGGEQGQCTAQHGCHCGRGEPGTLACQVCNPWPFVVLFWWQHKAHGRLAGASHADAEDRAVLRIAGQHQQWTI